MAGKNTAQRVDRNTPEKNRVYDEATEGEILPDTAPTSGGRAIDQLKTNLVGAPLDDFDSDATESLDENEDEV